MYSHQDEMYDFGASEDDWNADGVKDYRDSILMSYTNKDLKQAIVSKHEIMLRCGSYYAIKEDYVVNKLESLLK